MSDKISYMYIVEFVMIMDASKEIWTIWKFVHYRIKMHVNLK